MDQSFRTAWEILFGIVWFSLKIIKRENGVLSILIIFLKDLSPYLSNFKRFYRQHSTQSSHISQEGNRSTNLDTNFHTLYCFNILCTSPVLIFNVCESSLIDIWVFSRHCSYFVIKNSNRPSYVLFIKHLLVTKF